MTKGKARNDRQPLLSYLKERKRLKDLSTLRFFVPLSLRSRASTQNDKRQGQERQAASVVILEGAQATEGSLNPEILRSPFASLKGFESE